MAETSITGTISTFDHEKGFGTITAEDGRALQFDVGICRFTDPKPGEPVRFALGPSRLGGERVTWVERSDSRRLARASLAPPLAPEGAEALMELIATSDGATRDLLEELMRRRAAQFRVQQELHDLIKRFEACRDAAAFKEAVGALRELYVSIRPE